MTLSVQPNQLTAGGQATVSVNGSSATGQTVSVNIDNGEGGTDSVDINLDDSGNGSATWNVPSSTWETANFNYGSCLEVSRPIQGASDTDP